MQQETSTIAFQMLDDVIGDRQIQVFRCIRKHPEGITNNEISRETKLPINCVTPRTNELRKAGLVKELKKRHCFITGRLAISWTANKQNSNEQMRT